MVIEILLYCAYAVLVLVAAVMIKQLRYAFGHFRIKDSRTSLCGQNPDDLPTVSVCIPARNERHALTDCLDQVLASTYPKLEVIVLDDVSGDDTSALIKSFASQGVRFVAGKRPPDGWLGRNYALQGLADEASGTYIFYMSVDTRLAPQAIEHIVDYALANNSTMVSVMPRREDNYRASVIFSPLRYFWELIFHRRLGPATSTSAWLIRRDSLLSRFGGFINYQQSIQPETQIATELAKTGEYRFLLGSPVFGIAYEKKWRSQLLTSVRLLYPLLQSNVALAFVALLDISLLFLPIGVSLSLLFVPIKLIHAVPLGLVVLYMTIYASFTRKMWRRAWWLGALVWPYLLIQEAVLIIASFYQYSRGTVQWKGRAVSLVTDRQFKAKG